MKEEYMERLGVVCSPTELAMIIGLANAQHPGYPVVQAVYLSAIRHGLPKLTAGSYGLDLTTGEFLQSVPKPVI